MKQMFIVGRGGPEKLQLRESLTRARPVFPPPGPPRMREVRFRGRPPPVMASNPSTPVGILCKSATS